MACLLCTASRHNLLSGRLTPGEIEQTDTVKRAKKIKTEKEAPEPTGEEIPLPPKLKETIEKTIPKAEEVLLKVVSSLKKN